MEREDKFFVLSLLSFAVSLFLFPLAMYLIPQVWLGWMYHTPDFITTFSEYIQSSWSVNQEAAQWAIINLFIILGTIFGGIAYYAAREVRLDHKKRVPHESVDEGLVRLKQAKQKQRAMFLLAVKIAVIVFVVIIISQMMQWAMVVSS